jgi:hypothetical protein
MTPKAMTPEERQARVAWLTKLGVPVAVHDAIIDAPQDWRTTAGGAVLGIGMAALAIGATAATFVGLDAYVNARAAAVAAETGASLVRVDVGGSAFVVLFGLIALMVWVSSVLAMRHRVNGFLSSAAAMFNPPRPVKGLAQALGVWVTRRILSGPVRRAAAASATADEFLRGVARGVARPWGIAAAVLLPLAIVLAAAETNSFWVAGPAGIVEHSMLAPFSSQHHDFSEVTTLTTGCNHTDDGESLIYDVVLPSGEEFGLGADPVKAVAGNKTVAIEAIDAQIRQTGKAEHRRWQWLDRDPVHPRCLGYWARQFGSDGRQRLARLLRLTAQ